MLYGEIRQFLGTFIDIEEKNEAFDYNLNESSSHEDYTNELHKFNHIYNSFFVFNNYEILLKSDNLKQIVKLYNFYKSENDSNSLLLAEFLLSYYNENIPIVGLPGCVMYAKRTIFDLALPRLLADDFITAEELALLGEGGLCLNCPVCTYPNCGFGKGW